MELVLFILNVVLNIFVHFFMLAVIILFLRCFYDHGFQWSGKKAIILAVYSLIYNLIYYLLYNFHPESIVYYGFLLDALIYVLILYDYQGKRLGGLLRFAWIYHVITGCAALVSDIGSIYIFSGYKLLSLEMSYTQVLTTSALQILFFGSLYFYMYYRIYKKGLFLHFQKQEKIFAIVYTVLCIALVVLVELYGKESKVLLAVLGATFILSAALIPVFFYYLQISNHYQALTRHQESYIEAELAHFEQYRQQQEETARFRHDIRNNLNCIQDMLQNGRSDEASEYLKDILESVASLSKKYVTGDPLLDSIVGVKTQIMEQHLIQFELDGVLAGGLPWKPMDICNVFANALDNAIEACQKVTPEVRTISMSIRSTPQFWFITIINPVEKAIDTTKLFQKNGGYTTKSSNAQHGIGTYSMKRTVESYNAMIQADCTDKFFKLEIMIDKNSI